MLWSVVPGKPVIFLDVIHLAQVWLDHFFQGLIRKRIQYQQRVPLNGQAGIYLLPGEEWLLVLLPKTESLEDGGLYSTIRDLRSR
jgi:hypothetical protein